MGNFSNFFKNPKTTISAITSLIAMAAAIYANPAIMADPATISAIAAALGVFFASDSARSVQVEDIKKSSMTVKAAEEKKP